MSLTGPKPGCWPRGHHTSLLALHVAQSQVSGSPELAPQPFLHAVPSQEMMVTWAVPHRAPRAANGGPFPGQQEESRPSKILSVQFGSVAQLCPTLCDPMNRSTPGLPVHHHLPEFTQTHVHRVRDAIQPSHPLSSPSPPAPNPSQHQSLFQ